MKENLSMILLSKLQILSIQFHLAKNLKSSNIILWWNVSVLLIFPNIWCSPYVSRVFHTTAWDKDIFLWETKVHMVDSRSFEASIWNQPFCQNNMLPHQASAGVYPMRISGSQYLWSPFLLNNRWKDVHVWLFCHPCGFVPDFWTSEFCCAMNLIWEYLLLCSQLPCCGGKFLKQLLGKNVSFQDNSIIGQKKEAEWKVTSLLFSKT